MGNSVGVSQTRDGGFRSASMIISNERVGDVMNILNGPRHDCASCRRTSIFLHTVQEENLPGQSVHIQLRWTTTQEGKRLFDWQQKRSTLSTNNTSFITSTLITTYLSCPKSSPVFNLPLLAILSSLLKFIPISAQDVGFSLRRHRHCRPGMPVSR
jgi:hypothetical protein